ncbi:hypothetical protein KP509_1Z004000 [Ceratopteris richardii]|nr:hypothetical protein KP509_1Z004000 [Ceratopteris richardii]
MNPKVSIMVANLIWRFMLEKSIGPNTYSIACLLRALCQSEQLDEALKLLYKLGGDIEVQPHIAFCSIFLNGCWLANSAYHADKCLRYIKDKGLKEDESIYLELLKLAGRRKDLPAIVKAWTLIVNCCKPVSPALESYCAVIKSLCLTKSLEEALFAFQEMLHVIAKDRGLLLREKKLDILYHLNNEYVRLSGKMDMKGEALGSIWGMQALPLCGMIETKEELSDETGQGKGSDLHASDMTASAVTEGHASLLLNTVIAKDPSNDYGASIDKILELVRLAMRNVLQTELKASSADLQTTDSPAAQTSVDRPNTIRDIVRESMNFIICAASQRKDFYLAEKLFDEISCIGLKPDVYSYNAILNFIIKERGLQQALKLVRNMEQNDVKPNTRTYNSILMGFCKKLELDKAEALLERMLQTGEDQGPSVTSFNIILRACGIMDDPLRALRVFSKMVKTQISPNVGTVFHLVHAFGRVNFPFIRGTDDSQKELARRLQAIEGYMARFNLTHNFQTFNTVLAAFCTEGMADTVIRRLELAEGRVGGDGLPILTTLTFNTAINACNQAQQWDVSKDILTRMHYLGLKPNRETYNIFMNGCAEQRKVNDAFSYMNKIQEGGLKPDIITYNTLIKVCCYAGDADTAVSLLRDIEKSGLSFCDVTYVTILHCAVQKERIDIIEFLVEHMHQRNVKPTISICEHVVTAYLNCHQIEDAAEALRVLGVRMLPEGIKAENQSEDVLKRIFLEDGVQADLTTLQLLKDAMVKQGAVSESLLASRLSGLGNASMGEWNADESWWAKRLRSQYINL